MNTYLNKVFDLILNHATKFSVAQKDMPTKILILSDMEFAQSIGFINIDKLLPYCK